MSSDTLALLADTLANISTTIAQAPSIGRAAADIFTDAVDRETRRLEASGQHLVAGCFAHFRSVAFRALTEGH